MRDFTRRDSALTRGNAALHAPQGLTRRACALRPALPLLGQLLGEDSHPVAGDDAAGLEAYHLGGLRVVPVAGGVVAPGGSLPPCFLSRVRETSLQS